MISLTVKDNCVIAYDEDGFKAILDDQVKDRTQDRISYLFRKSLQYEEWQKILEDGAVFDQKSLLNFLRRREPEEIVDIDPLIAAVQNFKYVSTISGDFTFDDNNNYTFAFKVGDAEGVVRLPQYIYADMEIFNESGFIQNIELELQVQKPRAEGEKPLFALSCPKLSRYKKEAVEHEIEAVKKELDGYLIVAGNI